MKQVKIVFGSKSLPSQDRSDRQQRGLGLADTGTHLGTLVSLPPREQSSVPSGADSVRSLHRVLRSPCLASLCPVLSCRPQFRQQR